MHTSHPEPGQSNIRMCIKQHKFIVLSILLRFYSECCESLHSRFWTWCSGGREVFTPRTTAGLCCDGSRTSALSLTQLTVFGSGCRTDLVICISETHSWCLTNRWQHIWAYIKWFPISDAFSFSFLLLLIILSLYSFHLGTALSTA